MESYEELATGFLGTSLLSNWKDGPRVQGGNNPEPTQSTNRNSDSTTGGPFQGCRTRVLGLRVVDLGFNVGSPWCKVMMQVRWACVTAYP